MNKIFISYASDDRSRIIPFVRVLENTGWSIFWDRTITTGKKWREVIGREIDSCCAMIVIWSKNSVESKYVMQEAAEGQRRGVLYPVIIENVTPPFGFREEQAQDLSDWDGSADYPAFDRLVKDISKLLGEPPAREKKDRKHTEPAFKSKSEEKEPVRQEEKVKRKSEEREREQEIADALHKAEEDQKRRGQAASGIEEESEVSVNWKSIIQSLIKRKSLRIILGSLLIIWLFILGNINGKITDAEGFPLPGVSVTLTGSWIIKSLTAVTNSNGKFRIFAIPYVFKYSLQAKLEGFRTVIQYNIKRGNTIFIQMNMREYDDWIVDDTLDKLIEAYGGRKAMESVSDQTLKYDFVFPQKGTSGRLIQYIRIPNKVRLDYEIKGMIMSQAFDGRTAWSAFSGEWKEMSMEESESFRISFQGFDTFLYPEEHGISYTFIGEEEVDGKQCYVLNVDYDSGYGETLFINSKTYLIHKSEAMLGGLKETGVDVLQETVFADYINIKGIMFS